MFLKTIFLLFQFSASQTVSLCDKYTTALFKNNTAENQQTLVTLVVNTAIIGNYTNGSMNAVPGILAKDGNLVQFFDGSMSTTNENNVPTKVNFLDDGGAAPLLLNKPANGTNSRQYTLVTHLYQVFGSLLGCSKQADNSTFKPYSGDLSMFEVHKFMKLNQTQVTYFIKQVGLSALSFGVSVEDATSVGDAMSNLFLMRCSPPTALGPGAPPQLQSVCITDDCVVDPKGDCNLYTSTMTSTMTGTMTRTITRTPTKTTSTSRTPSATMSNSAESIELSLSLFMIAALLM